MKTQTILALIVLQVVTSTVWFMQVHSANQSESTCQLSRITESRAMVRALNELNAEYKHLKKIEKKTTFKPKLVVGK